MNYQDYLLDCNILEQQTNNLFVLTTRAAIGYGYIVYF